MFASCLSQFTHASAYMPDRKDAQAYQALLSSGEPTNPSDFTKLNQLNTRTKHIVYGYIRSTICEEQLSFAHSYTSHIASVVLLFIFDYFMYDYGEFLWRINDSDHRITKFIKSYKNGQKYESEIFVIGKLNWKIEAYPNGYHKDSVGSFKLYVKLLDLPEEWASVIVCRTTQCRESHSKVTNICTYKREESYGWTTGCLTLNEIEKMKYKTLTFTIKIRILQINTNQASVFWQYPLQNYNRDYTLEWDINEKVMGQMKSANVGKKFESPIFDNIWSIQCCPNGRNMKSAGEVRIYLQLCSLPKGAQSIDIIYSIECAEIGIVSKSKSKTLSYINTWLKTENKSVLFALFKSCKRGIKIKICIQILREKDLFGKDMTMKKTEYSWNQYVSEQKVFESEMSDLKHLNEKVTKNGKDLNCVTNAVVNIEKRLSAMQTQKDNKGSADNGSVNVSIEKLQQRLDSMTDTINKLMNKCQQIWHCKPYEISEYKQSESAEEKQKIVIINESNSACDEKALTVQTWLSQTVELGQYFDCFMKEGFDEIETVKCMTMNHLREMKEIKMGHRMKILKWVEKIQ